MPRQNRLLRTLAVGLSSLFVLSCTQSDESVGESTSTEAESVPPTSTSTTMHAAPTMARITTTTGITTTTAELTTTSGSSSTSTSLERVATDAEPGLRWDVGILVAADSAVLTFDRIQATLEDGSLGSALDFDEEPIFGGYTDYGFVNTNPRLRTYPTANQLELLVIDPAWTNRRPFCGPDESEWVEDDEPIVYLSAVPEDLVGLHVSLTFDTDGQVTRVRDISGC